MSLRVLVVDDASFVRDLVKRGVRQLLPEAEILEAQDGARAQALIRQKPFQLILSDWEMPNVSGEALLRWLREEGASTPFIMISSRGDRNHVVKAIEAGVSDYLSKPFSVDELKRKLIKQLKRMGVKPAAPQTKSTVDDTGSANVLTGAGMRRATAGPKTVTEAALFAKPESAESKIKPAAGRGTLRFASFSLPCELRECSLQAISVSVAREETAPGLFDSAAIDLEDNDGQILARLNAYVHALSGDTPSPDTERVRILLRLVDKDPEKLAILSKFITQR